MNPTINDVHVNSLMNGKDPIDMSEEEIDDMLEEMLAELGLKKALDMAECDECGEMMDEGDLQEVDGRMLCEGCAEDMPMEKASGDDVRKDDHNSAMVAWFLSPDEANALAIPGGEEAEDLHVTLAYFGSTVGLEDIKQPLINALSGFALTNSPLRGYTGGMIRFAPAYEDEPVPYCASVDVPGLDALRVGVVAAIEGYGINNVSTLHGFTPHITLAYLPPQAEMDMDIVPQIDLNIGSIVLAWGDERISFALQGKNDDMGLRKSVEVEVLKTGSEEERTSTAVAYPAMPVGWKDTQNDFMTASEIRRAAHLFLIKSQAYDLQHQAKVDPDKAYVVESWLAPIDFDYPLPDGDSKHITKGSWIVTTYYKDDTLWSLVKSNQIAAYSIAGTGKRRPMKG